MKDASRKKCFIIPLMLFVTFSRLMFVLIYIAFSLLSSKKSEQGREGGQSTHRTFTHRVLTRYSQFVVLHNFYRHLIISREYVTRVINNAFRLRAEARRGELDFLLGSSPCRARVFLLRFFFVAEVLGFGLSFGCFLFRDENSTL